MLLPNAQQGTQHLAARFFQHFKALLNEETPRRPLNLDDHLAQLGLTAKTAPARINLSQYYQLLGMVAPALSDSGFFLKLGQRFDITDAGVLGYASLSVENLRQSWELTSRNYALYPHPLTADRVIAKNQVAMRINQPGKALINPMYLQEEWLSSTWQWMCQRLPELKNKHGLVVKLNYPAPAHQAVYKKIFGGKIVFNQAHTELCFPESWYDIPFPTANPATAELCQQQCALILNQLSSETDLVTQVQRQLLLSPQRSFPSQQEMAEHFAMPAHSFHRLLKKSHRSYRQIVNEVRVELAKDYLKKTHLPLQEVSYLLGYEHAENFYRAFKKLTGVTPSDYRHQG